MKQSHFYYGADYCPEQWDQATILEDVKLMKQAHVNYVSINIFTWALIQDNHENFHFEDLDQVVELLTKNGIMIDMGTGTATPPAWLLKRYPEILPVNAAGNRMHMGSRQQYCPSNLTFKHYVKMLVEAVVKRYADHPGVVMWHVSNEYTCHIDACYCDNCRQAFQEWLKQRYQTIERLNQVWYTKFWSQYYYDWSEIGVPGIAPTFTNPGEAIDYKRFISDQNQALYLLEKSVIQQFAKQPVMTNLMGLHKHVDGFKWAPDLDVITWNGYPNPFKIIPYAQFMANDLMRGLKQAPFLLMESATSAVNWRKVNGAKVAGKMRLWSYEAIAHGSDGIMFFQWRQSPAGSEKFHSAMIGHANNPDGKIFKEVATVGNELSRLDGIVGTNVAADVAILFDWENWWALDQDGHPRNDLKYIHELLHYYKALRALNITVTFAHPEGDLSSFKTIIAPTLYSISPNAVQNVRDFVDQGGTLVTNYFSGIVDENDHVYSGSYPGGFRDVLGIEIEEFFPIKEKVKVCLANNKMNSTGKIWSEVIKLNQAQAWAYFDEGPLQQQPAVTINQYGAGKGVYLGTKLENHALQELLKETVVTEFENPFELPSTVNHTCRFDEQNRYHFFLNYGEASVKIKLKESYQNVLTDQQVEKEIDCAAQDVVILRELN
jgi:beta-galactosidase